LIDQLIEVRDRTAVVDVMLGQVVVQSQMRMRQIDEKLLPIEKRITVKAALLTLSFRLVTEVTVIAIARETAISISLIAAAEKTP
jgi:hypothetical protein